MLSFINIIKCKIVSSNKIMSTSFYICNTIAEFTLKEKAEKTIKIERKSSI